MKTIQLKKGREKSILRRHPWIFSGAIEETACTAARGELVRVVSAGGETLGWGWYSPESQIRVRLVSFGLEGIVDETAFISERVASAIGRRATYFVTCETNALRLVNAESDGLPGVVADCYDGHIVCQFTSAGAEKRKVQIAEALLKSCPGAKGVSARTDVDVRRKEGLEVGEGERAFEHLAGEEAPEQIEIKEGEIRYFVDPRKGHKTGFYLDQRDARAAVGALANGCEVLNCFCYTGGFGLAAAAGGALHVTQVDVSGEALAMGRKNAALTLGAKAAEEHMTFVEADVFKYLRTCRDSGRSFDLIVLDPPKFAESKAQVMKAARGYKDINLLAMKLLRPGGILATFSCSGAMDAGLFETILAEAAVDAKREFRIIGRTRAGSDHAVSLAFADGEYLKGVILQG